MSVRPTTWAAWFALPNRIQAAEEEILVQNVNWLLSQLYAPDAKVGAVSSAKHLSALGLEALHREAINWGDLSTVEAQRDRGRWAITIEEAAPSCPILQEYIRKWLAAWGWPKVIVRTEW